MLIFYSFKVPLSNEGPGIAQKERDAWVQAIHKLCSEWKRKSRCQVSYDENMSSQPVSIPEEPDDNNMDLESNCELGAESVIQPPADFKKANHTFNGEMSSSAGDTSQTDPMVKTKPVPKPRSFKIAVQDVGADDLKSIQSPTSPHVKNPLSPSSLPPSPSQAGLAGSPLRQGSQESESLVVKGPPSLNIPAPPPLPFKDTSLKGKSCTKAFHWDLIGYEKVKGHYFTNMYSLTCFPNHFTFHD